jgi:activator of 2-hydroxyglutaryl-CoA dehydratase
MNGFLGIDVGSVSTNLVVLDESGAVRESFYLRTQGQPIKAIKTSLNMAVENFPGLKVLGVGTTGSARHLASVIVGADTVKNEITAHTVCAAGTGSFLDQQAARLGIPIEQFGEMARRATLAVRIAGRCAVFAESDMIHKQQMGYSLEDIGAGLCEALVRNFLNNLGKGKEILSPVVFQGGVAANVGMRDAFNKALATEIIVPEYFGVMGAVGAAILAREHAAKAGRTMFRGFSTLDVDFSSKSVECRGCPNQCEVVSIQRGSQVLARWGDRCGKWSGLNGILANEELAEA